MNQVNEIPCLPETAPFTAEQRAYLNGFLAGLFSRTAPGPGAAAAPVPTLRPLSILFGSQTGNCENLARRIAKEAGRRGFAPTIFDLGKYPVAQLASETRLLVVTSTYGDGEPPDNARAFWDFLNAPAAPRLARAKFSLCALGDTNYPKFCRFGRELEARLASLGAVCSQPRVDCDVDYEAPFAKWLDAALASLADGTPGAAEPGLAPRIDRPEPAIAAQPQYGRNNPFPAPLLTNLKLNGAGSAKDTRHFEFELSGSGLTYEAGDALAIRPTNCPALVEEMRIALGCGGAEAVPGRDGGSRPLEEALRLDYEITRIPVALLQALAARTEDAELTRLAAPTANGELTNFLRGREIIDLLHAYPQVKFTATEFVGCLKKLQPRLYSISSSPKAHPGQVHLCVGVVRYDSLGRARKGVCSTFLAERVSAGAGVPVFVHHNKAFRPPSDPTVPMIMIGPGTGIAPFRGFLEERQAVGATGKNWLFFGDQKSGSDFLYQEQLARFEREGVLTRLSLAWSRDPGGKVYVQHRLLEHAREIWDWLEQGAGVYVCGDAARMAKDVDLALHQVIERAGAKSPDAALEYVRQLKAAKRYQRDVY